MVLYESFVFTVRVFVKLEILARAFPFACFFVSVKCVGDFFSRLGLDERIVSVVRDYFKLVSCQAVLP